MSEYKEKIVNVETGEETWRNLTTEELAEIAKAQEEAKIAIEKEKQLAAKKASAEAKLVALGLTADDLKALGLA